MSTSPALTGQVVVVIGGTSGIGRQTAGLAHDEGADIILTGPDPGRLEHAAAELSALSTSAFDATDPVALQRFFTGLPGQIDHVMVTAGIQYYAPLAEIDFEAARRNLDEHLLLPLQIGRDAARRVRPGGTLIFMTDTGARRPGPGMAIAAIASAAVPAIAANLAVEIAPVRVNLIAAGFADTPLSARLLGDDLEGRRRQLRATLPIGRMVGPADVASLAVHLMTNTAVTGATYDIDGGEQFVAGQECRGR
jgi:NAD(P)-dependent dehydrogenase (short-subunit alcohol dehydrogenase family)